MSKTSFKTISYNSSTKVLTINGVDYTLDSAASGESVSCGSFGEVSLTSEGVLTINGTAINLPLDLPDNLILDVNGNIIKASDGYILTTEQQVGNFLTFSSPNTFTLNVVDNQKYWDGTLEYSTDTENWNTWTGTSTISSATDGTNHNLYLRGSNNTYITGSSVSTSTSSPKAYWVLTGSNISCDGNIETLLDYATVSLGNHPVMASYCYRYLFYNCTSLTTASELPATTLAEHCYYGMFQNCTSLTVAPSLPAVTLANYCYWAMFYGCSSLTSSPELPATTLASYCYYYMFQNCTSLTTAPSLPATTLANSCYGNMFYGCTALTSTPSLPVTTLTSSCYYQMFYGCTSLTTAPNLPATTLTSSCYYGMFRGCTSLTTPAVMGDATTMVTANKSSCYNMYYNCTSLYIYTSSSGHTAFMKAPRYSTSSSASDYQATKYMFSNCKVDGVSYSRDYPIDGQQYYY